MPGDNGKFSGKFTRRNVLKGIGGLGAAAAGMSAGVGNALGLGSSAVYQYYHTPWTTIESDLSTIADQGYDAIQVPPAQRSRVYEYEQEYKNGKYNPPLGYQPIDLQDFNSEFGTEAEYQSMIDEAHNQGLDVIADAVINHVAAGGDYFDQKVTVDDLPQFQSEDFHPECSIDYSSDYSVEGCWLVGLRDLAQEEADVRKELKAYVDKYKSFGVDGIRWDAAKHVPESFFDDYANQWASDLYTVGEVIPEKYDGVTKLDYLDQYANTGMSVTDYPLHKKLVGVFSYGDAGALSGYGYVNRNPLGALTFVANHDSGDAATPDQLLLAYAYILTYEGYPRVYSDDIGVSDDAIRNLLWIKNNLINGSPAYDRITDYDVYCFERYNDALVAINNSTSWQTRYPYTSWRSRSLNDYTGSQNSFADGNGYVEVNIPPEGYVVLAP